VIPPSSIEEDLSPDGIVLRLYDTVDGMLVREHLLSAEVCQPDALHDPDGLARSMVMATVPGRVLAAYDGDTGELLFFGGAADGPRTLN
jgi:hypothetical protein